MYKIIRYIKGKESVKNLNEQVSLAYKKNADFFGKDADVKIAFLYKRSEMDKFCQRETPKWMVGASAYNGTVALFSPSVFEKASDHPKTDFLPTLIHEIAHVFVRNTFRFRVPLWLYEGIPGYIAKQYKNRHMEKSKIQKFKDIHYKSDWMKTNNYNQAYFFTKFLIDRFAKRNFLKFASDLGENDSFQKMTKYFKDNFKISFSETEKSWQQLIFHPNTLQQHPPL